MASRIVWRDAVIYSSVRRLRHLSSVLNHKG
jgi:hypothetical protein